MFWGKALNLGGLCMGGLTLGAGGGNKGGGPEIAEVVGRVAKFGWPVFICNGIGGIDG
jgi:hypothetical protein